VCRESGSTCCSGRAWSLPAECGWTGPDLIDAASALFELPTVTEYPPVYRESGSTCCNGQGVVSWQGADGEVQILGDCGVDTEGVARIGVSSMESSRKRMRRFFGCHSTTAPATHLHNKKKEKEKKKRKKNTECVGQVRGFVDGVVTEADEEVLSDAIVRPNLQNSVKDPQ